MKKILALLLVLTMVFAFAACGNTGDTKTSSTTTATTTAATTTTPTTAPTTPPVDNFDPTVKEEGTMTYAEYDAAAIDDEVVVEFFVQAIQDLDWKGAVSIYGQDPDGAYFVYEMPCEAETVAKLVPGTRVKVTGYKGAYAGEVEVVDCTLEILEGTWLAEAADLTDLLASDELIAHQNQLSIFKGMTVKSLSYKQDDYDKDIYVTLTKDGVDYDFCVENNLTDPDTAVYQDVAALAEGDVIDVTCFLYWWNGPNPHITSITVK